MSANYNPIFQDTGDVELARSTKSLPRTPPPVVCAATEQFDFTHQWVRVSKRRLILFYVLVVLSGGLLSIICVNMPNLYSDMTTMACTAAEATMVYVCMKDGTQEYCPLEVHHYSDQTIICFELIAVRYFALSSTEYELNRVPSEPEDFSDKFVVDGDATGKPTREYLKILYGLNRLNLPVADTFTIVVLEMLSPFYLFQYFAIGVWLGTNYVAYSIIILLITALSIYFVCSDKLYNIRRLHDLAASTGMVEVTDKQGTINKTESDKYLLPGDCFYITQDMAFPCDAILIRGKIVVDESMLTGESVPVTKTEFVKSLTSLDATKRKANLLYCGTKVKAIGTHERPIAMTFKTGFRSSRGEIIGTLARPQREIVSFMPDALRAILFMVLITTCIFGWSAAELKRLGTSNRGVVLAYLTALTIAVPPGLVACLSIATSISVMRLGVKKISISDTMKLNAAGYVTYACFDKTGTLTDENIVFKGVELFRNQQLVLDDIEINQIAMLVMAACHSLSLLDNCDKPVGDQLEVELFRESGWGINAHPMTKQMQVYPPYNAEEVYTIVKTFEYSPDKLRAGVVVMYPPAAAEGGGYGPMIENSGHSRDESKGHGRSSHSSTHSSSHSSSHSNSINSNPGAIYLLKGSPEIIVQMCDPSTVPANIQENMTALAKKGFRVLAMAYRDLKKKPESWLHNASQSDLESCSVMFLGLVYFQNKLKPDTWPMTISSLQDANIKVNMITGDHIYTAIAISAECNILPAEENRSLYIIDANDSGEIVISSERHTTHAPLIELIEKAENPAKRTKLTMTGGALRSLQKNLNPQVFNRLMRCVSVFARVKPDQKKLVVMELKNPQNKTNSARENNNVSGKDDSSKSDGSSVEAAIANVLQEESPTYVMFCGDGANDMEALSAATVGVSLCDTATTVAASVVSLTQSPYSTVEVLKEGRSSLVTAYVLVLYNIMYAIIQYFMTCFLNNMGLIFGDSMYIVQDLFFSFFLGLSISRTLPSEELTPNMPPPRLFTAGLMFRLFVHLGVFPLYQFFLLCALRTQGWYTKFDASGSPLTVSWAPECSTMQILALAQLMIASVVVTIGKPFRLPWYRNRIHLTVLTCQTGYLFFLLFDRETRSAAALQNHPFPFNFSFIILALICANAVTSAAVALFADYMFPY
jgi:cation-transporting ATPase 13A2